MAALATLAPVIVMIALGFIAREKKWITQEEKEGANTIIFNLLFPVMIFNILLKASVDTSSLLIVGYVFAVFVLAMIAGKVMGKKVAGRFAHLAPFLMTTCEGGSVALPLYLSIVGTSSNTVIYDIAGTIICFIVIPVVMNKQLSEGSDLKDMVKKIVTNSFVIAVMMGLVLNVTGFYGVLERTGFAVVYDNVINMITSPIVGIILFVIGYNLKIDRTTLVPVMKFLGMRIVFYALVIAGFFVFFPTLMKDPVYLMGVLIYFMCPTGFGTGIVISPLYKDEEDHAFSAGVISLMMVVTLIVYVACVLFIA